MLRGIEPGPCRACGVYGGLADPIDGGQQPTISVGGEAEVSAPSAAETAGGDAGAESGEEQPPQPQSPVYLAVMSKRANAAAQSPPTSPEMLQQRMSSDSVRLANIQV